MPGYGAVSSFGSIVNTLAFPCFSNRIRANYSRCGSSGCSCRDCRPAARPAPTATGLHASMPSRTRTMPCPLVNSKIHRSNLSILLRGHATSC